MLFIAEINGFLKTLIIILLVYFTLRFLAKLLWPLFVGYITKKASQKMESVFKGFQEQAQQTTNQKQEVPRESKEVVGEYIDYEELD